MIESLLSSFVLSRPWPAYFKGKKFVGQRLDFPKCCEEKCYSNLNKEYSRCEHGFDYFLKFIEGQKIVVGGTYKNIEAVPKNLRVFTKGRCYSVSEFEKWHRGVVKLIQDVKKDQEATFSETLRPLHEISKWANQVHKMANKVVNKSQNFTNNFSDASSDQRALLKSAEMLVDSFDMVSIYYNPASAAFGRKKPVNVYRLVHKIVLILNHAEGAANNKKIKMEGAANGEYDLFESFKILPLSIIQNAIKYSCQRDICVTFDESVRGLSIKVTSTGPLISETEMPKIYDRGYRGVNASKIHHEGMGVGLYIGKIVAEANKVKLLCTSRSIETSLDGILQGVTEFEMKIQRC